jgi:glucose/arabinose dehydrogenase
MSRLQAHRLTCISALLLLALSACTLRVGSRTRMGDEPAPTAIPLTITAAPLRGSGVVSPEQPISLPPGFAISVFASGLSDPRMMAIGPDGSLYVAERGAGRIVRLPDGDWDGIADGVEPVGVDLASPSSLAFYQDGSLYVGETRRVVRLSQPNAQGAFQGRDVIVDGLPAGGHNTRTVLFSPDWTTLFVSVGSSCKTCDEEDPRRAAI